MEKFKVFFDIEKEERWLNDQLQKGYRCTHINSLGFVKGISCINGYVAWHGLLQGLSQV